MNEKFFDLSKEKQDRMINAGLKVFGRNGYRFASTDEIVKEAGISKGLLFHYFGSKLGMYTFLYDYSAFYMTMELKNSIPEKETDYFAIVRGIQNARANVLRGYPYMQLFLDSCETEEIPEAAEATVDRKTELGGLFDSLWDRTMEQEFKNGVDREKLTGILRHTIHSNMRTAFLENRFQPDHFLEESLAVIDMMESLTK